METITFLGTSGSVVTKRRMCAGLLFRDKLIDVGFGVLANFVRSGLPLDQINDVYISHTHSDHIGDFTGLIWAMAIQDRTKPLRVVSSAGTAAVLKKVLELQSTPRAFVKFSVDFIRPEEAGTKYTATVHNPQNLAYRFETSWGDFVYVGDTALFDKVGEFASKCDLMIHDAMFLDGQESVAALTNHSTARDAARVARLAQTKRLVLTHISPTNENLEKSYLEQATSVFDGEVIVAKDHLSVSINR